MKTKFLAELLFKAQNQAELESVLDALLTPKEIAELHNRIEIFQRLAAGQTQREIAGAMGVGIATVSRGAKARNDGFSQALEKLL